MAVTLTIGGTTFTSSLNPAAANRYVLDPPEVGDPEYEKRKESFAGADGKIIRRLGFRSRKITVYLRYVATNVSNITSAMATDKAAWADAAVTIACDEGTFNNCELEPGSFRITKKVHSTGRGTVSCDCVAVFSQDRL